MTNTTCTTTVTKIATNRFAVEGVIAVLGMRLVNEVYCRVHTSKKAADADAAKLDSQNAAALVELAEYNAARKADVTAKLAARAAARATPANQFAFSF